MARNSIPNDSCAFIYRYIYILQKGNEKQHANIIVIVRIYMMTHLKCCYFC